MMGDVFVQDSLIYMYIADILFINKYRGEDIDRHCSAP